MMAFRSLRQCVEHLESHGQLLRIDVPVDPRLEAAEIQRRVFAADGPALYFSQVKGCRFPMASNLFGTIERIRLIFGKSLDTLARLATLEIDPADLYRRPRLYMKLPWTGWIARPKRVAVGPVLAHQTTLAELPQLVSWPEDGGAYITLPQVYTEDPDAPGLAGSNLGMYRVQISGGRYEPDGQAGLHYQIHRGMGVHHARAIARKEKLRVNVFVGGPPAMTFAAVMPMPEGISELAVAGVLGSRRVPMICRAGHPAIAAEADFCLTGHIEPKQLLPEGPFGDHLGYYSLAHDFPVMRLERVYHRPDPIWPFTVVGRPPQEDSMFGRLIHEMLGPAIPRAIPGIKAVHAVDAAGVHPLLLAIGSERYVPYEEPREVHELMTLANALLGHGQLSLAKYLFLVAGEDDPELDVRNTAEFLRHLLQRVDWRRHLHFQTSTTIDTLDYSGEGLNRGSKAIVAVAGPARRTLPVGMDSRITLPESLGFVDPRVVLPGILVVKGPSHKGPSHQPEPNVARFCDSFTREDPINAFPLIVLVDDARFASATLSNFLWTTCTRSNPSVDIHGIASWTTNKHFGCDGSLVIDARSKPHHAPPVLEDPNITRRVDQLASPGGPLHGVI